MTEVPLAGFEHALHVLPNGSYILFKADWCGDCRRGVPPVKEAVAAARATLLVVDVAQQPQEWKAAGHPLRGDPRFQLSGVPTLVLWRDGAVAAKLASTLEKAATAEAARSVAAEFIRQHSLA
ncbi:hypothetical protein D9Q98_009967 [Chlorella vulgaris]|uniref:Thioredoxin domain-containing protein n=1 Tax=Chlorella vulgaris TaxID=3077 RepID=A0A9D4TFT0_CHLVU|nr:hypothetical protein D9Q98_009967 [Chlorella vulgaris]